MLERLMPRRAHGGAAVPRRAGGDATVPGAARMRRLRRRDVRLWIGLALILVSMIAGARLISGPDGAVVVWRASHDLARGGIPVAEPALVQLGDAAAEYLPADAPIDGRMLIPVPQGALIPARAVGDPARGTTRLVTVPVDPLHAPVGLAAGDRVDVWATAEDAADAAFTAAAPAAAPGAPVLVLPEILVIGADPQTVGVGGEIAVVLEVPVDAVPVLVQALRSGVIDLTAVPITAASSAAVPNTADPITDGLNADGPNTDAPA